MVGFYNNDCFLCFVKSTTAYLTGESDDLESVRSCFFKNIKDDQKIGDEFIKILPKIKKELECDLDFFMQSDPAIDSRKEIILSYPGYKAITCYRVAHALRELGLLLESRLISELAHSATGIDIHPGASIKAPFFIDHGTGIVIGETAIIGSHVKMYQGVTLGAISLENAPSLKGVKRHPTVLDHVTIYACATILGDITIGSNSTIGANVFLTESVGSNMRVLISKPELIFKEKKIF